MRLLANYFASDDVWYFPPPAAFDALVHHANTNGKPEGRPYFSEDGITPLRGSEWERHRSKFICPFGKSNVWDEPGVRGAERLKSNGKLLHPNQKPLSLTKMLLDCSSHPGDVIWEPFVGTGTTLAACVETGRHGYGAEFDLNYYQAARRRLGLSGDGVLPPSQMGFSQLFEAW